ncbi:FAD-dependent oxidoreductase [uncultured Hyphomicrobium sp.]|uniref:NAD(P)/FAD-dependent oxidoreductase n=1 Tax=uncultured Hyphomicrobium sp. TaxID=194373 RepID=UPI0025D2B8E2|nr:FAD-dependent oxidoreductase [uncultured Hyphomicrobium sp.]
MSGRVYDADIYVFGTTPETYWTATAAEGPDDAAPRLETDLSVDVAVIGGGYAGLSAAHQLASRHGRRVAVLEAGAGIGWGASGLNAGFVSMGGSKLSTAEMVRRVGEEETRRYWATQARAVEDVRAFIADHAPDCDPVGDGNLCVAHHRSVAPVLAEEAETLSQRFGVAAEFIGADRFRREMHDGPETHGALRLKPGFAMHPLRLVRALSRAAKANGAQVFSATPVVTWIREGRHHRLETDMGACVRAERVIVAANGYMPNGLHRSVAFRSLPAISSIIVTQAYGAEELERRGFRTTTPIYNSRGLLSYYRRLPDGRILFGGRGDTQGTSVARAKKAAETLKCLTHTLPAFADAEIAFAWRGLVSLTARRSLAVGLDPDDASVAFAFGCHGSGTATMPWAGRLAADLAVGAARETDVPTLFRGLPPRLPPSNILLRWGLRAAYGVYALRDALHM